MAQKRKTHADVFKARVALDAIKGVRRSVHWVPRTGCIQRSLRSGSGS